MSEDQKDNQKPTNVISLVSVRPPPQGATPEEESEDPVRESMEWAKDMTDHVLSAISAEASSPINGLCLIFTHEDGGVSHAHKCIKEDLPQLIGALEMKKFRMITNYDK